jgi:hypothetical protein
LIEDLEANKNEAMFKLAPIYDIAKTNNVIIVKATYNGQTYEHAVDIGIMRQGEPGTNGTGVVCKIAVSTKTTGGTASEKYPYWI